MMKNIEHNIKLCVSKRVCGPDRQDIMAGRVSLWHKTFGEIPEQKAKWVKVVSNTRTVGGTLTWLNQMNGYEC